MPLMQCRECHARISNSALACPRCGDVRPRMGPISKLLLFVFIFYLFIILLIVSR